MGADQGDNGRIDMARKKIVTETRADLRREMARLKKELAAAKRERTAVEKLWSTAEEKLTQVTLDVNKIERLEKYLADYRAEMERLRAESRRGIALRKFLGIVRDLIDHQLGGPPASLFPILALGALTMLGLGRLIG